MTIKKNRKTYTAESKAEALKLAERVGVAEAARQLKLNETQIYNWRNAAEKIDGPPIKRTTRWTRTKRTMQRVVGV